MTPISLDHIIRIVAVSLGVPVDSILNRAGRRSPRDIVVAKQVICYISRKCLPVQITELELKEKLQYNTHTSIIYSVEQCESTLSVDASLKLQVQKIEHVIEYFGKEKSVMSV
jgi:chromosomal replication initiation ATPase DnaA